MRTAVRCIRCEENENGASFSLKGRRVCRAPRGLFEPRGRIRYLSLPACACPVCTHEGESGYLGNASYQIAVHCVPPVREIMRARNRTRGVDTCSLSSPCRPAQVHWVRISPASLDTRWTARDRKHACAAVRAAAFAARIAGTLPCCYDIAATALTCPCSWRSRDEELRGGGQLDSRRSSKAHCLCRVA